MRTPKPDVKARKYSIAYFGSSCRLEFSQIFSSNIIGQAHWIRGRMDSALTAELAGWFRTPVSSYRSAPI